MFYKWEDENKGVDEFEIEVSKDLHDLTSDIISKVAFGSNYEEGKEIFDLLEHYHLVSLANRSVYHMTKTRTLKWVSSAWLVGPTDEIHMALKEVMEREEKKQFQCELARGNTKLKEEG
ncbi:hypothetical protein JHK82_039078 [Glycine max]|nr:hypothetical protein JHK87_039055 [Glycine soja]KAG4962389.1 hypothetical protein JHK86_039257 [Glycine max]KAG4964861.1 hypothetical protein JHK85_039836 [Glycine max]KAG5109855.1 hypothetical protein JHK82_039078 [Glycine max]KAG5121146.1 hypothetical protein JHK84_039486 [Glycine max]